MVFHQDLDSFIVVLQYTEQNLLSRSGSVTHALILGWFSSAYADTSDTCLSWPSVAVSIALCQPSLCRRTPKCLPDALNCVVIPSVGLVAVSS